MLKPNDAFLKAYMNGRRETPPFRPNSVPVSSVLEGKNGQRYELGWVKSSRPLRANGVNIGYLTQTPAITYTVGKKAVGTDIISIALMVVYTYLVVHHKLPQWGKVFTNQSVNQTMIDVYSADRSFRNQLLTRGYSDAAIDLFANWGLRMLFLLSKLIPLAKNTRSAKKEWKRFVPLLFTAFMDTYWNPLTVSRVKNNIHKQRDVAEALHQNVKIMMGFIIHMVVEGNIRFLIQGAPVTLNTNFIKYIKKAYKETLKFVTK